MHTTNVVGRFRLSSVTRISNKFFGVQDLPRFGISKQNRVGIRDEGTHRMRDAENNLRDDGIERTLGSGWRDWANIRVGRRELSEPLVRDEGIKEPYWVSTVMFVGLNKNKFIITVLHGLPLFLSYQFSTLFTILMRMFLLVHQPVVVRPSVLSLRCCDSFSR